MNRTLIIFARTPEPGAVKTRLAVEYGDVAACRLYEAFIRDLAIAMHEVKSATHWYVTPDVVPFADLVGDGEVRTQEGSGLGARMRHAFEASFSEGSDCAVIIGTDSPLLSAAEVEAAFEILESGGDSVIGPAEDGGYYLLGLRPGPLDFFERLTYSRSDVFERTLAGLWDAGYAPTKLPAAFDIDRPEDVRKLARLLERDSDRAPRTREALVSMGVLPRDAQRATLGRR
ncbi:MAG: glycosyltransferase [Rhodothermales bacterium]|nr:glycosyltransferase [Rhodothermales bacterium]